MRILRIDNWDGTPGGAQDYIREVTAELGARGHETRVVQLTNSTGTLPAPTGERFAVAEGRVARLGEDIIPNAPLADRVRGIAREFAPDLVSLHHFDARFETIAATLPELGVPIVVANHDAELVCPISTLVRPGGIICDGGIRFRCLFTGCHVGLGGPYNLWQRRRFDARIAPVARVYLCPSRSLTDYLHSNGYRPAIHLPSFARIPAEVRAAPALDGGPESARRVGYLGRLEWYKGVDDLIAAIALARSAGTDVELSIAGDGPFESRLRAQVARLGLDGHVRFEGRVVGPAKEAWFASTGVIAVPSSMWENFPLVALEALVRGRPVVATRIGGIPDIVDDGETGFLVPIASPPDLATAVRRLVGDPGRAAEMGAEGRRRVLARFTPELHVERLLAVYQAVLDGRPLESGGEAAALVAR